MKKEDIRTIIIFILLIVLIISLWIYNDYRNSQSLNVDRKVTKIFNKYSYGLVLNEGRNLFLKAIKISNLNNLEVERNNDKSVKYYAIDKGTGYKKILNFNEVEGTLTKEELEKYLAKNEIVMFEYNYYTQNNKSANINKDYVGSIIKISKYDDDYVYFTSLNYYCENSNYIGLLQKEPDCNYKMEETSFTIVEDNNNLRINDLESISKIIE